MRTLLASVLLLVSPALLAQHQDHEAPITHDDPVAISSGLATNGDRIIEFHSNYGAMSIDLDTKRFYIATPSGIREFDATQILQEVGMNPADYTPEQVMPVLSETMAMAAAGGTLMGPCALSPCQETWDPIDGRMVYTDLTRFDSRTRDSYNTGGGNNPYGHTDGDVRFNLEVDFRQFNNWRSEQCNAFNQNVSEATIGAVPTGVGCAAVLTGGGAVVCAGGLLHQGWLQWRRTAQMSSCSSRYPGPGRWPGSGLPTNYGKW